MKKICVYIILGVFSLTTLTACALGPDFLRPATSAQDSEGFINALAQDETENKTQETQQTSISRWWERIDDPLLQGYIDQLLKDNLALREATERINQAREQRNIQRGGFFPSIGGSGSASRSFSSGQAGSGLVSSFLPADRIFIDNYAAELNTSWEIDLFGRIRRSTEAAQAGFRANIYDQQALTHSLIADVLNQRVAIAVNKNLLELAQKNAQNREEFAELVRRRFNNGVRGTTGTDVFLADENFTTIQADVHEFERILADDIYTLDVLLGKMPGTTNPLEADFPLLLPPQTVPVCLPANLLDRRPDLRASELRIKAANAEVGVALADLYPQLTLGGSLGFNSEATNTLFTADKLAGSMMASVMARIFEGGALRANIRLQESEARELAAGYTEDVLNAVREVETSLKAEQELLKEMHNTQKSVEALRGAEKFAQERYIRGILTLQEFLEIQQRRYAAEQILLRLQQVRWNTRVALYMALGGDWFENRPAGTNAIPLNQCETQAPAQENTTQENTARKKAIEALIKEQMQQDLGET